VQYPSVLAQIQPGGRASLRLWRPAGDRRRHPGQGRAAMGGCRWI